MPCKATGRHPPHPRPLPFLSHNPSAGRPHRAPRPLVRHDLPGGPSKSHVRMSLKRRPVGRLPAHGGAVMFTRARARRWLWAAALTAGATASHASAQGPTPGPPAAPAAVPPATLPRDLPPSSPAEVLLRPPAGNESAAAEAEAESPFRDAIATDRD